MKIYNELYFRGMSKKLSEFVNEIKKYAVGDWKVEKTSERWKDYLFIDYCGKLVDKARISIYIGDIATEDEINVGNIIPLEKNELTIDEYNAILTKFYEDVIKPYEKINTDLEIKYQNNDNFEPTSVISEKALKKLELFCNSANKSTGSSHPCDRERWFDFICQTVDDGRIFDSTTLADFLQDESYWGEKSDEFIGVIGKFAWDEEHAYELASEYEMLCEILQYYKKQKGID